MNTSESKPRRGWFRRTLAFCWGLVDGSRRLVFNLLWLLLLGALLWSLLNRGKGPAPLQEKTALVLDLRGRITEQQASIGRQQALSQALQGQGSPAGIRLRDVLDTLEAAQRDPQISHALLLTDEFGGGGLATLREVGAALQRFKAAGKPVYAWGSSFDQRDYYLAAQASEVWLHPMGSVAVEGYGRARNYYKDVFDKVGVQVNVMRAGRYKNAAETYVASGPSPATVEADKALYDGLWGSYLKGVEQARKLPAGSVMAAIDSLPASLQAVGGDLGRWSKERQLVDALKTRDEMREALIAKGAKHEDGKTFRQIHWAAYLARQTPKTSGPVIGVVVAEGGISDGDSGPGSIGGRSTAGLIRQAREDEQVKAVVLRVNSPGGSAFGSELVRRELELTRKAGKPVVVSMGDVAASGGYWISLASDEMLADEATITGSIGVVAMFPTAHQALDKVGLKVDGYRTTWLANSLDPRLPMDPRLKAVIESAIGHTYSDFLQRVAQRRGRSTEQIDQVAQGRVWTGADALKQGLVDRLGGFGDAVKVAALRAKLPEEGWRLRFVEAEPGRLQRWLERFGLNDTRLGTSLHAWGTALGLDDAPTTAPSPTPGVAAALSASGAPWGPAAAALLQGPDAPLALDDLGWLAQGFSTRRPEALAHCLCGAP